MEATNQFHGKQEQLGTIIRPAVQAGGSYRQAVLYVRMPAAASVANRNSSFQNWNGELLKSAGG
jgi:hypothetical protein